MVSVPGVNKFLIRKASDDMLISDDPWNKDFTWLKKGEQLKVRIFDGEILAQPLRDDWNPEIWLEIEEDDYE
jgi:hypothetical protein